MSAKNVNPRTRMKYRNSFLADVHTLIYEGYQAIRAHFPSLKNETHITSRLHDAIEKYYETSSKSWCDGYQVSENPPEPHHSLLGNSRKKPDLTIYFTNASRPRFVIEAKRLGSGHPAMTYCGNDGLGCFLTGIYAEKSDYGGMLGYVQSQDISHWNTHLSLEVVNHSHLSSQCPDAIIPQFPDEWSSMHQRTSGKPIRIYHLLLDCQ